MSEDQHIVACPQCDSGFDWAVRFDGQVEIGIVRDPAGDGNFEFELCSTSRGVIVSVACTSCDFVVDGDWNAFEQKLTLPDPAALLALRDRLSK